MVTLLPKPGNYNTVASPEALAYAMQFMTFDSSVARAEHMAPGRVDGLRKHVRNMLMYFAIAEEGEGPWICRQLHAGDIPPTATTQRDWFETTGVTTDQFVTAAKGNGTTVRDDTFIGIYGYRWVYTENRSGNADVRPIRPPVSYVRYVVGGTRVAEWDLFTGFVATSKQGGNSSVTGEPGPFQEYPVVIAESPIWIAQNKTLTIQFYEMTPTTATDFSFQHIGLVVERVGGTDGLNP